MPEKPSPTAVFYGSATPEQMSPPKPERSKTVEKVQKAIDAWLDRVGPKNVEKHFVEAHERVLATLNSDQRKEIFKQQAEKWRKAGKRWGIAATVIDASLASVGIGLSIIGLKNPNMAFAQATALPTLILPQRLYPGYIALVQKMAHVIAPFSGEELNIPANRIRNKKGIHIAGISTALTPALASLGIMVGSGPGHWLAHLAAGGKEQFGKMKAKKG